VGVACARLQGVHSDSVPSCVPRASGRTFWASVFISAKQCNKARKPCIQEMLESHVYSMSMGAELRGWLSELWVERDLKIFLSSGAGLSRRLS